MNLRTAAVFAVVACAACERHPTATNARDNTCFAMTVEGPAPQTALIRLTAMSSPDTSRRKVWPSPYGSDASLVGVWRYAYHSTDSMYAQVGDSKAGYALWVARSTTSRSGSNEPQWMGGIRVIAPSGAFTTTVKLTRADCRD